MFQTEREKLSAEISSLQHALSEASAPRVVRVEDIPPEVFHAYLAHWIRSIEFQVTCRWYGYYLV